MFRIAICEDIELERKRIIEKVNQFFKEENLSCLVREYSSGEALLAEYEDGTAVFDLILMDIRLGGMNGLETSTAIRAIDRFVPIAFLTSSRAYAIEGYDVGAIAYMVKPVEDEKFFALLAKLTQGEKPLSLTLKMRGRSKNFDYRDLVYLESQGHRVILHLSDGAIEAAYYKLDDIEQMLKDPRFMRTHKSYLVNMDYIQSIETDFCLSTGEAVPIRRQSRKEIVQQYMTYNMKKQ